MRFGIPALVGIVVLVAAAQLPVSAVPGSPKTGPTGLGRATADPNDLLPTARWEHGGQQIELSLRPRRPCVVELGEVTSTAPGRIEVQTSLTGTQRCTGSRHLQTFLIPRPAVLTQQQGVRILVGPDVVHLHAYVQVGVQPTKVKHRRKHKHKHVTTRANPRATPSPQATRR